MSLWHLSKRLAKTAILCYAAFYFANSCDDYLYADSSKNQKDKTFSSLNFSNFNRFSGFSNLDNFERLIDSSIYSKSNLVHELGSFFPLKQAISSYDSTGGKFVYDSEKSF